ncbi:TRAP transporter large permease subunit [Brevibacillus sp. AY1]|uniref:TRAP transporter large permease subunit n=1 Tax=Brevibacillus sp. AY1 TaxID=2807621 RepID=UPI0032AF9FDC
MCALTHVCFSAYSDGKRDTQRKTDKGGYQMGIELAWTHGVYVLFVLGIILMMVLRRDTSLISIIGIAFLGLTATGSVIASVGGIFGSFIYAITELLPTILVICIIVAMSHVLTDTGVNETMIRPMTHLIRNATLAYWVIGIVMMVISWFFWPSPAVALIGAVMLPVAIRAGLPAIGVAVSMNLFGHGIALSGDYVIQGAPSLTAKAAGIPVNDVIAASIPLVIVMGVVTTVVAFWYLRKDMKNGMIAPASHNPVTSSVFSSAKVPLAPGIKRTLAALVPILFVLDVVAMFVFDLRGGEATALVGGTALLILIAATMLAHKQKGLEQVTTHLIQGFQFGFKVFGPVIPIAAFFYMGDSGFNTVFGEVLPQGSHGIVNDLGVALAHTIPLSKEVAALTLTAVGVITGLDGSGFSGITLAGSLAQLFATALGSGVATLTALGQIAAIWVGGGTLVPWALIPAAAICGVDPFELARRNLYPVVIGLLVTTIFAMFLL